MFGKDVTLTAGAYHTAIGGASAQIAADLSPTKLYAFATNTACWIKQGTGAQTAAKAVGNVFVPAGGYVFIHGGNGTHISVLQDTAAGLCSLSVVQEI